MLFANVFLILFAGGLASFCHPSALNCPHAPCTGQSGHVEFQETTLGVLGVPDSKNEGVLSGHPHQSDRAPKPDLMDTGERNTDLVGKSVTSRENEEEALGEAFDELYITLLLTSRINKLNSDNVCWYPEGVKGLVDIIYANISQVTTDNITIPQRSLNISSSGNLYSIDLTGNTFLVNGLSESTYLVLTYIHIFTSAVAFFLVYPIMLLIKSLLILCDLVDRPLRKHTFGRWYEILYIFAFVPLAAGGIATGIVAMGTSENFRTQHGIIGFIAAVFTVVEVALFLMRRQNRYHFILSAKVSRWVGYLDVAVTQLVLLLSSYALSNGFDDWVVMGLCSVNISMTWAFSVGMMVVFLWNGVQAAMALEWFLSRRATN